MLLNTDVTAEPSKAPEKLGVKTQKWGFKNHVSTKICLSSTNFALFLAKVGRQLTTLPPMLPKTPLHILKFHVSNIIFLYNMNDETYYFSFYI